jgi:hypothetical protein
MGLNPFGGINDGAQSRGKWSVQDRSWKKQWPRTKLKSSGSEKVCPTKSLARTTLILSNGTKLGASRAKKAVG